MNKPSYPQKAVEVTKDVVNHPAHYETGKFECIDGIEKILRNDD